MSKFRLVRTSHGFSIRGHHPPQSRARIDGTDSILDLSDRADLRGGECEFIYPSERAARAALAKLNARNER